MYVCVIPHDSCYGLLFIPTTATGLDVVQRRYLLDYVRSHVHCFASKKGPYTDTLLSSVTNSVIFKWSKLHLSYRQNHQVSSDRTQFKVFVRFLCMRHELCNSV